MIDHDGTTRFFDEEAVRKAFWHPDWPRGTEVVVYARKEDREKVLAKMSQMGYVVTEFVDVDGLQAEIMGEGRFMAAKADALRQPTLWEASLYGWPGMGRLDAQQRHLPFTRTNRADEARLPEMA